MIVLFFHVTNKTNESNTKLRRTKKRIQRNISRSSNRLDIFQGIVFVSTMLSSTEALLVRPLLQQYALSKSIAYYHNSNDNNYYYLNEQQQHACYAGMNSNCYLIRSIVSRTNQQRYHQQQRNQYPTKGLYVLTMPTESIIEEQSSTIPTFVLDDLIDESVRTQARRPIIIQFNAAGKKDWIWRRWKGTVFSQTWESCIFKMIYSACVYILLTYATSNTNNSVTNLFMNNMMQRHQQRQSLVLFKSTTLLSGFDIVYGQLLVPITTVTLTFFVDQAYTTWRRCLVLSRTLQGQLHDISLLLASHAARTIPSSPNSSSTGTAVGSSVENTNSDNNNAVPSSGTTSSAAATSATSSHNNNNEMQYSTYTDASRQLLIVISRYVRLFNLLAYASLTRSHRPIVTPRGMRRLVERGIITEIEREILVNADIPATQRHTAVLLWIFRIFIEGCDAGHFVTATTCNNNINNNNNTNVGCSNQNNNNNMGSVEQQFTELIHTCRGSCGAIGSTLHGRMPLAYGHIVQILVDSVLWTYPFLSYAAGMSGFLCVIGTGLLTLGYQGLFELSKRFLDPYDNENFGRGEDPLVIDTLIAETNAGSVRWMNGLDKFPIPSNLIQDGNLSNYILPLRGYSVEEIEQQQQRRQQQATSNNPKQRKRALV